MKAIILAAGMGTRLGEHTQHMPKGMLVFNGKPLLQRQIETLRKAGISDISIVRGYHPEKISFPGARYYFNKDFANTNMVESLFTAEQEFTDDLLVCYGDIIYEQRVIEQVKKAKAAIGVTVDSDYGEYWRARLKSPEEDLESLVIGKRGTIVELGELHCSLNKARVRYVGLLKFSKKGLEALKKVYYENKKKFYDKDNPWLRSKSFKKAYMTDMLQALINAGYEVKPIIIQRGWLEFDTVEDVEKTAQWLKDGSLKRFFSFFP